MKKFRDIIFKSYLEDGERILEVARRHILVLKIQAAKSSFFGIMVPLFLWFLIPQGKIIFSIWIGVGLFGVFYHYLNWYYDVWLVTNKGIVDIERQGFFDVKATRVDYHLVQDITVTIKGVWQTLFNYGDVTLDRLVSSAAVILKDAANPKRLERVLKANQAKYVGEKSVKDHEKLKGMLSEMIAYHVNSGRITIKED